MVSFTGSTRAGIAVAQHTTKLPIKISITGGTIKGYSAFYESNPQNNSGEDLAKIQVSITGGNFYAINGGAEAIHAEDLEGFVSAQMNGEEFVNRPWASSKIDAAYVAEGFVPSDALEHDPAYTIVIERTVTFEPDNGEQATTVKVGDGTAVEKPATDPEKEGYLFDGWFAPNATEAFDFENTPITGDIKLTAKEFDLLQLFVTNRGTVFSREQMLETVWKYDYAGDARTVDVHIRRLREKIERDTTKPEFIFTKWGVGYYFTDQD
jgi:uncharacterized repeat protein (TIGR02543 family)